MAAVQTRDILLRVGGRTLHRLGVLAAAGAGRGYVEVKETFTRAAVRRFRDRDGIGKKAAADKVAIEYPGELSGLVDQFGYPYGGPVLNGARTQLVTDPENFGAWSVDGTPVLTSAQADPFAATAAYLFDDNDAAAAERVWQIVGFTADATKALSIFMRAGTSANSMFGLFDLTAGVWRHRVNVAWSGGVPTLSTDQGTGTLFAVENWGGGWYRLSASVNAVVAANTNRFYLLPTQDIVGQTGTAYFFGANAWNAPFPSSYQGPGEAAGAGDSLTLPFNFGPMDLTVLARVARPVWADASGSIPTVNVFSLGVDASFVKGLELGGLASARQWDATLYGNTGAFSRVLTNIAAGAEQRVSLQAKNMGTAAPLVAMDVGTGLSAFDDGADSISAWDNQTLYVGRHGVAGQELESVLLDLIFARNLHSLQEMLEIP